MYWLSCCIGNETSGRVIFKQSSLRTILRYLSENSNTGMLLEDSCMPRERGVGAGLVSCKL